MSDGNSRVSSRCGTGQICWESESSGGGPRGARVPEPSGAQRRSAPSFVLDAGWEGLLLQLKVKKPSVVFPRRRPKSQDLGVLCGGPWDSWFPEGAFSSPFPRVSLMWGPARSRGGWRSPAFLSQVEAGSVPLPRKVGKWCKSSSHDRFLCLAFLDIYIRRQSIKSLCLCVSGVFLSENPKWQPSLPQHRSPGDGSAGGGHGGVGSRGGVDPRQHALASRRP